MKYFIFSNTFSCADGYYGNPRSLDGSCKPCSCNLEGSVSSRCDSRGICVCLPGISGDKCNQCQPRYAVENGVCICKSSFIFILHYFVCNHTK